MVRSQKAIKEKMEGRDKNATNNDIDYDKYDIDPVKLDYDINCNNVAKIKGTNWWIEHQIYYDQDDYWYNILGIGNLTIDSVDLDDELILSEIRSEADSLADEYSKIADQLRDHAPEITSVLVEEWEFAADVVIAQNVFDHGIINTDHFHVWTSNPYGFSIEVKHSLQTVGIDDEYKTAYDVLYCALADAVSKYSDSKDDPNVDYIGYLRFDVDPWELRTIELLQNSVFQERVEMAKLQALRETNMGRSDIANVLNTDRRTLRDYEERLEELIDRAEWTVDNLRGE